MANELESSVKAGVDEMVEILKSHSVTFAAAHYSEHLNCDIRDCHPDCYGDDL